FVIFPQQRPTSRAFYFRRNGLSATLGPAISSDLVDKPTIEALIRWFPQRVGGSSMPCKITVARRPLGRKFSAKAGVCLATVFFQVTMVSVEAGGLPSQS